jgi:hypothetical protein
MWLSGVLPATARDEPGGAGPNCPCGSGACRALGTAGTPGGPYGHRTGTPLERGNLSRMGITVCNVPAAPQASPFTAVMTLITYGA